MTAPTRGRRIGAYGLCRAADRVLLVRSSGRAAFPGVWQLPGGGVDHGEHPAETVVREFGEETGLVVRATGVRSVVADVHPLPGLGVAMHTDRIVYDVALVGGEPRVESSGTTDRFDWLSPAEAGRLPLMPFTAELLGLPVSPLPADVVDQVGVDELPRGELPMRVDQRSAVGVERPAVDVEPRSSPEPLRRQRFAAYGLVTDPAGRVLLTLIADGYPGAGRWHLPGGGTDHGEQPDTGLLRELVEESGQLGRVTGLVGVSHVHNPAAFGPEGVPLDWHAVRVIYTVTVDVPTSARVTDAAGGSTARSAWFTPGEAAGLLVTEVTALALRRLSGRQPRV